VGLCHGAACEIPIIVLIVIIIIVVIVIIIIVVIFIHVGFRARGSGHRRNALHIWCRRESRVVHLVIISLAIFIIILAIIFLFSLLLFIFVDIPSAVSAPPWKCGCGRCRCTCSSYSSRRYQLSGTHLFKFECIDCAYFVYYIIVHACASFDYICVSFFVATIAPR
jgi:hypothetical protein